jgi:hypothetical protein
MNFNMNDKFSVTLTEFGAKKYNAHLNMYPHPSVPVANYPAGESITKPLWVLFQAFGQDLFLGATEMPFEKNRIVAVDAGIRFDKNTDIAIVWGIEDVQSRNKTLSDAQAMLVLKRLKDKHDCNDGICWETIDIVIDDVYPNGGSVK